MTIIDSIKKIFLGVIKGDDLAIKVDDGQDKLAYPSGFNSDQIALFRYMETTRVSMFITGSAGTGKTTLLRYFANHTKKKIVLTSYTGMAASQINGQTIHSLFRIPLSLGDLSKYLRSKMYRDVIAKIQTLVIDEVSMVRPDIFWFIDMVCRVSKGIDRPFGGIQLLMFGDPFQLPPVIKTEEEEFIKQKYKGVHFFNYLSKINFEFEKYELSTVVRQQDSVFIDILNRLRVGKFTKGDLDAINAQRKNSVTTDTVSLCAFKKDAETVNGNKLNSLPGDVHIFRATVLGEVNLNNCPAAETLRLKKGAKILGN